MIKEDLELLKFNKLVDDANEILFKYLLEKNPYCLEISNIYEKSNQEIINTLVSSYSQDIFSSMFRAINDPRVISYLRQELSNSSYTFNIDEFFRQIFKEYIKLSTEFKQKKGLNVGIEYIYNMIIQSGLQPDVGGSDVPFEIFWGNDIDPNAPFNFKVKGYLLPFLYENVVKEMAHPVGFGYNYRRSLALSFIDYVNDTSLDVFTEIKVVGIENGQEKVYDFSQFKEHVINYDIVTNQDGTTVETIAFVDNGEIKILQKRANNTIIFKKQNGSIIKEWDNSYGLVIKKDQITEFKIRDAFAMKMKMNYFSFPSSPNKKIDRFVNPNNLVVGNTWQVNSTSRIKQFPKEFNTAFLKFYLSSSRLPNMGKMILNIDKQSFISNLYKESEYDYCHFDLYKDNIKTVRYSDRILPSASIIPLNEQSNGTNFAIDCIDGTNGIWYKVGKRYDFRPKTGNNVKKLFSENGRGTIYSTMNYQETEGIILGLVGPTESDYILIYFESHTIKLEIEQNSRIVLNQYIGSYQAEEQRICIVIGRNDNVVNCYDVTVYINETEVFKKENCLSQQFTPIEKVVAARSAYRTMLKNLRIWDGIALTSKDLKIIQSYGDFQEVYDSSVNQINNYINRASAEGLYEGVGEEFSINVRATR